MNKSYLACIALVAVGLAYFTFTSTTESINDLDDFSSDDEVSSTDKSTNSYSSRSSSRTGSDSREYQEEITNERRISLNRDRTKVGLTLEQINELGEKFKNEEDSTLRREILEDLIAGMTADNALDIRKFIAHMSDRSYEWREFHKAFGAVAGETAVLHGEETKGRDVELSLVGWVSADPEKAMEWYRALDEKSKKTMFSQERLAMAVLEGLAENDPKTATDFMISLNAKGGNSWRAANIVGNKVWKDAMASGNVDKAMQWLEGLPDDDIKKSSQAYIARNYAKMDPLKAAQWVDELTEEGSSSKYTVGMVAESWRKTDPEATVNWISGFDDEQHRLTGSYYSAFYSWGELDPNAATSYVENMDNSRSKDYAIYGLTRTLSNQNPDEAMKLASTINDKNLRLKSIMNNSRTVFKDNPEGLENWLAESNLSSKDKDKVLKYYKRKKR